MIKVLVVDDSAVVRQVVTSLLQTDPEIFVLGAASDPVAAMQKMRVEWPDVILLDVEMPKMDGISFLKKIMSERPTPVIMCSTLTEAGAQTTLDALSAGAVTVLSKPKLGIKQFLLDASSDLLAVVKAAGRANLKVLGTRLPPPTRIVEKRSMVAPPPGGVSAMSETTQRVVAIGTSTGGTQALEAVLSRLPRVSPGMVIVQHMPQEFTAAFAARLNGLCEIEVKEAQNNDRVFQGRALIAPGGKHMLLKRSGAQYLVEVVDGPLVNRHKPSVNVLFGSVAKVAGPNALGIIMTGMGDDGASGLSDMRRAGARTIAQDEESCVVYGMPKEAVKRGAVEKSVTLLAIDKEILKQLS